MNLHELGIHRWHHLTHAHTSAARPGVGEVMLCRRRLSRRTMLWVRFADGMEVWSPAGPADAELVRRIAGCSSPEELHAAMAETSRRSP